MTTLQRGDLVLVTGATGYIGGHVVSELIAAGYKVRGTSRNHEKAEAFMEYVEKKFGSGKLDFIDVPDMMVEGAYEEAVKGVSGIIHLASVLSLSAVPEEVIAPAVEGVKNILRATLKEPNIKSLVLTSSSSAAVTPVPDKKLVIYKDSWNEEAIRQANTDPNPFNVYAASKAEAEKAFWRAVKEVNPPFQVATVLPNTNFGPRLRENNNTTASWLLAAYIGTDQALKHVPPQYYINTRDDAKLNVIALTDPACDRQRIFAFAAPFNWNDMLAVFRKLQPGRHFDPYTDVGRDLSKVPNEDAEGLLRKHYGHGFTSLEESVKQNVAPPA